MKVKQQYKNEYINKQDKFFIKTDAFLKRKRLLSFRVKTFKPLNIYKNILLAPIYQVKIARISYVIYLPSQF